MSKYGVIEKDLMAGYYTGLIARSGKDPLPDCPFCGCSTIYVNQVENMQIAYCVKCLASAPLDVWQRGVRTETEQTAEYKYNTGDWIDE